MSDLIEVVVRESGTKDVVSSFATLEAAAKRTHASLTTLQRNLTGFKTGAASQALKRIGDTALKTQTHVKNLNTAMRALSNVKLGAALTTSASSINSTASSVNKATKAFTQFSVILVKVEGDAKKVALAFVALKNSVSSLGGATKTARANLGELKQNLTGAGAAAKSASADLKGAARALKELELGSRKAKDSLKDLKNDLRGVAEASKFASAGMGLLIKGFIGYQTIKRVAGALVEAQVGMQQIHYGLLAATGSSKRAAVQMEYLRENAQKLGLDLQTSAQEYTRLAASADAMNVSMEDQQKLYTALSQASTVLHLDAQKVQFATLALTQMFSKGKIQAEELRRQLGEAIPGVVPRFINAVRAVTKGTDLAKYSFEDLMKRGLLDTAQFLPQMVKALEETGRGWQQASTGLNAEINRLKTAWFNLKVELSEGLFADVLVVAIRFLSQNLQSLAAVVTIAGVAIVTALAPVVLLKVAAALKAIGLAFWAATGPIGVAVGLILGIGTAIYNMRHSLLAGVDDVTSFGDIFGTVFDDIWGLFSDLGKSIGGFFTKLVSTSKSANEAVSNSTKTAAKNTESWWLKAIRYTLRAWDYFAATVNAAVWGIISSVWEMCKTVANNLVAVFEMAYNAITFNFEEVGKIQDRVAKDTTESWERVKKSVTGSWDSSFANGMEAYLNKTIEKAQARANDRIFANSFETERTQPEDFSKPAKGDDSAKRALEQLRSQYAAIVKVIDPAVQAELEYKNALKILEKALKANLLDMKKYNAAVQQQKNIFERVSPPFKALVEKYEEERKTVIGVTKDYKTYQQVMSEVNRLKEQGIKLSIEEIEVLRQEAQLTEEANRKYQARISVLDGVNAAQQEFMDKAKAIKGLKDLGAEAGGITQGQAVKETMNLVGEDNIMYSKTYFDAHYQMMEETQARIQQLRDQDLISDRAAWAAKAKAQMDYYDKYVDAAKTGMDLVAGMMASGNRKAFAIGKAAAIASAVMDTYRNANAAFFAMASIPYVGPALGAAAAAAAIVTGMANVARIRAQQPPQFRTGGGFTVGGRGGTDSQLVQFMATPGERVQINTPAQAKALEKSSENTDQPSTVVTANFYLQSEIQMDEFRNSKRQIEQNLATTIRRAR